MGSYTLEFVLTDGKDSSIVWTKRYYDVVSLRHVPETRTFLIEQEYDNRTFSYAKGEHVEFYRMDPPVIDENAPYYQLPRI